MWGLTQFTESAGKLLTRLIIDSLKTMMKRTVLLIPNLNIKKLKPNLNF